MKVFALALLVAVASAVVLNDPSIVEKINSGNYGWKAENNKFSSISWENRHQYVSAISTPINSGFPIQTRARNDLPESFNWLEEKPLEMVPVRDQSHCGSCWAFSASEALSNRFNIKGNYSKPLILSPQDLVSCDNREMGCNGGYPVKVWQYLAETGICTDACYPYTSGGGATGVCQVKPGGACPSKINETAIMHKCINNRQLAADEKVIMTEILENGPVGTGFQVYQDFFAYKSGVYRHVSGGLAGGHAVMTVGWGVDKTGKVPLKYWIVQNSWGNTWGQNGYFWILRGTDECKYESFATMAGDPVLNH